MTPEDRKDFDEAIGELFTIGHLTQKKGGYDEAAFLGLAAFYLQFRLEDGMDQIAAYEKALKLTNLIQSHAPRGGDASHDA